MNKHVHRLVFDRRRGMRVPAAEHARGAGKAAGGQTRAVAAVMGAVSMLASPAAQAQMASASPGSISAMGSSNRLSAAAVPPALSATRSVSSMVSQVLASGRPNLPVFSTQYSGDNKGLFDPLQTSADGYVMTLTQKSGAILVNWDSFDIGKGYTMTFVQPDGGRAYNKVRGSGTSLIDGVLKANGEVIIENGAGVIFGKNARVNTGSLVATALSVAQAAQGDWGKPNDARTLNLYGQRAGAAVFEGSDSATAGFVATQPGAVIQSAVGGKVLLVAPRVVNQGLIETPKGDTVLAAGKTVYLFAPTDLAQRGLLVAVDNFSDGTLQQIEAQARAELGLGEKEALPSDLQPLGTVENTRVDGAYTSGLVRADKGTINLVGAAIRQKGQLTATTAVKGQNGAIFLRSMKDTFVASDGHREAKTLGNVELGTGSITEVLPSAQGVLSADGSVVESQRVVAVVQGEALAEGEQALGAAPVADVVLTKIGVGPDEVVRAPVTLEEPVRPTVPAEDASADVKAKYAADLARYASDKLAYDAAELTVQRSSDTYYRSRIDILGSSIALRSGSRVQAPSGEVNILAADDWQTSALRKAENSTHITDNSRILMEKGAVVDVSGLDNVLLPAQRNQLKTQLFSLELADSPLQRASVVYRQTVMADARGVFDLGDTSGYYSNLRYTAPEMSTSGGLLRMQAQGALMLDPEARVDFSGGAVTYDGGSLVSSVLIRNGLITLAGNARRDVVYDTFISDASQADPDELARRGLSGLVSSATANLPGQFVGKSAGVAMLAAPVQSIGAVLDGSVRMSEVQRNASQLAGRDPGLGAMLQTTESIAPLLPALDDLNGSSRTVKLASPLTNGSGHLFASLRPTAGWLVVGREVGIDSASRALSNVVSTFQISGLAQAGATNLLTTSQLQRAGLAGLSVYADTIQFGQQSAGDAPSLQLAAGGSFLAKARVGDVQLHGSITVPGGDIKVMAQGGDLTLTQGSRLDAGGTRRDDRFAGAQSPAAAMKGGTITLVANDDVVLAQGSEVDVSGAAWRGTNGQLVKGDAGTISIQLNDGVSASGAMPDGMLTLAGTLTGHDFADGATLSIGGLPAVVVGGSKDKAFSLSTGLFAERGFGTVKVASLGSVEVLDNTQVLPVLQNMQALSPIFSQLTGRTFFIGTLEAGLRSGTHLSLQASTTPNVLARYGLTTGANLSIGKGAVINMGLGGSIDLAAGGSIDMAGSLLARGGDVSLTLLGERGVTSADKFEDHGYLKNQAIRLHDDSLIDVSGAVKAVRQNSAIASLLGQDQPLVGEVLAAGTVTLGGEAGQAVRGQLLMAEKAKILLNGESAQLSANAATPASTISAAAGTLNIVSTDGFSLLGTVEAKAPDASVAGGTLNIVLSREGTMDKPADAKLAYPSGEEAGLRSIRIADGSAAAKALDGERRFGEGVMSSGLVNSSGFDRVQLRADESIELNQGVNLMADAGRTRLQSVVIDAPVLSLKGASKTASSESPESVATAAAVDSVSKQPDHVIQAHHVAIGPVTRLKSNLSPTAAASERVLAGDRWLSVQAGLIELNGDTAVQGAKRVDLSATLGRTAVPTFDRSNGEIRFIGQRPLSAAIDGDRSLKGQFSFQGELNLTAGQVYATTLSDYTVKGTAGSTLNIDAPAAGSSSQTPLSALASLTLDATNVDIDGVVRQPIGTIEVKATQLTLGDEAVLSVSADGVTVPVGTTVNGSRWVYSPQGVVSGDVPAADNLVQDLTKRVITKQITLNGDTISLSSNTMLEAQAGGDIVAWQFNAGVGGSTDTYLRPGVFAVLPNYGYDFAPHDADIRARTQQIGTDLKAGDQVTLSTGNGVLAAGTYTLLDARYGILPGAVLVSTTSVNVNRALPEAIRNDDGSVIVSGYRTSTGTSQNGGNDARLALVLEPEAAFRAKSDVTVTSINELQRKRATSDDASVFLPGDAGRIALSSKAAFDWQARFNLRGKGDLKAGEFDLAMPDIVVRRAAPKAGEVATVTRTGADGKPETRRAGVVGMDQLQALGADSVLLGGIRTTTGDGQVEIERQAATVAFEADATDSTLRIGGELLAVATDKATVAAGVSIVSGGADTGESRRYQVKGDGALLLVGHRAATEVEVTGASSTSKSLLDLGSDAAGAATVVLSGNSVQLDSTGQTRLNQASIDSQSIGLGAGNVVVGEAQVKPANALVIEGDLLTQLNAVQRLNLRASSGSLAIAGGTQLGSATTQRLTLDAPQLLGVAAKGASDTQAKEAVSRVVAQEVVLRNGSGQAATGQDTGVGTLQVQANPVLRDGRTGGVTIEGSGTAGQRWAFASTQVSSQGDIVWRGKGQTTAAGNVTLDAARLTASADAEQKLVAAGSLVISKDEKARTLNETLGAGGSLGLQASTIEHQGNIDIEAGRLNLLATGNSARALVFAAGSTTNVSGRVRQVSDTYAVASGAGSIRAQATQGGLHVEGTLKAAAPVLPSGVSGENPAAGTIELIAAGNQGKVVVGQKAVIDLSGASGQAGSLVVDARTLALSDAARLAAQGNAALAQNGLDQLVAISRNADGSGLREFNVRQREGLLELNTQVKAAMVALTADNGALSLGGQAQIDASTAAGGVVQLQAKNDLILGDGARIDASATRDGANGGDVLLASSDGSIKLGAATVVADSAGDDLDGRIVLRARRTQDAQGKETGMKVSQIEGSASATFKAGRVQLEGVDVQDKATLATLGTGAASATNLNLKSLVDSAATFASSTNQTAILKTAGLSTTANASVRGGVEVRVDGDFTVNSDLQLTASAQPMNLTIRAGGEVNVNGSVSAGLNGVGTTSTVQLGQGASLRFVAGADTDSANVNAIDASKTGGNFNLASGKLIRTTTGSIDVHAAGNVRLLGEGNTASSIYVTGGLWTLSDNDLFASKNVTVSINAAKNAYLNGTSALPFTERGERLTVSAGGDVGSFIRKVDAKTQQVSYVPQSLLQGTGNYFVHGGVSGGLLASSDIPVAWATRFNDFRQGLGSFGGGNIDVQAGANVSNLAVIAPTTAREVIQLDKKDEKALKVLNGGDISVAAGGDIVGGLYFLGRGDGRLTAGGSVRVGDDGLAEGAMPTTGQISNPGTLLALMDGHWAVNAVDGVTVAEVYNPTAIPFLLAASNATTGLTDKRASMFYTYQDDAGVSLTSLQGDVRLAPDAQNFKLLHTNSSPVGKLTDVQGSQAAVLASVLPSVLSLVALDGDVTIDTSGQPTTGAFSNDKGGATLLVKSSSQSDVNLYAGQDLVLRAKLQLLDGKQLTLPTTASTVTPAALASGGFDLTKLVSEMSNDKITSTVVAEATGLLGALASSPIDDGAQTANDRLVRLHAGNDVLFVDVSDQNGQAVRDTFSFLRSNRPTEIVAGRDIVNPHFLGQNFDDADTTRVVAGRDIVGTDVLTSSNPRVIAVSGPGALQVEAGRDVNLNQMAGVLAVGKQVNSALPDASAKITVSAGAAKAVNLAQLRQRHGSNPGLRPAVNAALVASGLETDSGASWADLSDDQAFAAFAQLTQARQVEAVQTFLDATFAALYLPAEAGQGAAHYRSAAFQRKKQEAMWEQIELAASAAKAIAVSTNEAEEAARKQRRQALFNAAEAVADLAGHGRTFDSDGDVNVVQSRVHNLGQGGGTTLGQADGSLGGIDVIATGQVVAGLPTPAGAQPGGFINFDGGSFRSLSLGDFLAGDQKVIAIGRGDLLIYTVAGNIDSGKGSNTSATAEVPRREYIERLGKVVTVGQPPTSGSGFQKVQTPSDHTPVIGLYAPNGEIRALDAFIKGDANIDIVAPAVKGADNIGGASGVAAAPAPTVSINLTPKVADTAAGTRELSSQGDAKAKAKASSLLTVDLLGFGDGPSAAGVAAPTDGSGQVQPDPREDKAAGKTP